MPFILVLIGVVILVAALRNTHGDLGNALQADLPGFTKWALAISIIGGMGFVPGIQQPSRWLLALVLFVLVLKNYVTLMAGLSNAFNPPTAQAPSPTPAAAAAANPSAPIPAGSVGGVS